MGIKIYSLEKEHVVQGGSEPWEGGASARLTVCMQRMEMPTLMGFVRKSRWLPGTQKVTVEVGEKALAYI